jgi:hypothetical protein
MNIFGKEKYKLHLHVQFYQNKNQKRKKKLHVQFNLPREEQRIYSEKRTKVKKRKQDYRNEKMTTRSLTASSSMGIESSMGYRPDRSPVAGQSAGDKSARPSPTWRS